MIDAIDIWTLSEPALSDGLVREFRCSLSPLERERADRYRREEDSRRSVAARGLLRHALSERASGVDPASWLIEIDDAGRPLVRAPEAFSVSITHTPGLVAVAVTRVLDVGVDAEFVHRRVNFDQVVRRWYSEVERAELEQLPDGLRRRRFFRYWVLKEAYAKARGLGLAIGLDRVRFVEIEGAIRVVEDDDVLGEWGFEVRELAGELLVAAAAATQAPRLRWHDYAAR